MALKAQGLCQKSDNIALLEVSSHRTFNANLCITFSTSEVDLKRQLGVCYILNTFIHSFQKATWDDFNNFVNLQLLTMFKKNVV